MPINKIYSFIGLATKAGKTITGQEFVEKSIKKGTAELVIVAEDASDNTKKLFANACEFYDVEMLIFGKKSELGRFTGKDLRANVAITDKGFATRLIELINSYKA